MDYLCFFSLLLSCFQSVYCLLNTILSEGGKERAMKMSSEFSHFYAAVVKGLNEAENKNKLIF